jgi:hypothetical protein
MPFKSDSQRKLCYLLKGKGQAGSWDCDEWSIATDKKKLPEHVADQEEKQALEATNKLVGGDGDNKKPSDFSKGVLDEGVEDEKEHTNDLDIAREIAIDHLSKDPEYYKKIKLVEGIDKKSEVSSLISKWSGMSGRAQYPIEALQGLLKGAAGGPPPRTGGYKPPSVFSTPPRLAVGAPPAVTPAPAPAPAPAVAAQPPSGVMGYANKAWDSAKSGVSGVMSNVQSSPAYNNASLAYQNRGAIAPTAWNAVQAGFGSDDAKTKLDADANRFNWSALKDNAAKAWNDPSTQNGIKKMQGNMEASVAENYKKNLSWADKQRLIKEYKLTPMEAAQAAFKKGPGYDRIMAGETARIKGDMSKWTAGLGDSISKSPFGVAANYVGTGVKNYATQSEAKRMTAQAAMPYVDWMRANPWAKYVGGGLALGAGAYGLHKLFGGGGAAENDEDEDGNILTKSFNRGLNPAPVGRSKRYW